MCVNLMDLKNYSKCIYLPVKIRFGTAETEPSKFCCVTRTFDFDRTPHFEPRCLKSLTGGLANPASCKAVFAQHAQKGVLYPEGFMAFVKSPPRYSCDLRDGRKWVGGAPKYCNI